jgi:4-carboxymuconolactone decarboxylase
VSELGERGDAIRREVLGDEYVDAARAKATPFTEPLGQLVDEFCWGAIWGREGLDRRTRSLVNLGTLTALNRLAELEVHLRGALRNGVSAEEIRETLLQSAVYCGIPAAIESFRVAQRVLDEHAGG